MAGAASKKVFVMVLLCIMVAAIANNVIAAVIALAPTDDAHVDGLAPYNNYGRSNYLYTSGAVGPAHAYLKFYLGDISTEDIITDVTLNLFYFYGYSTWVDVYHVSNDSWDELSITWNNRPDNGIDSPVLDSAYVHYLWGWESVSWNLLQNGAWDAQADVVDSYVSLLISPRYNDVFWGSKEFFEGYNPSLTVITTHVPITPSGWLLLSGLVALVSRANFREVSKLKFRRDLIKLMGYDRSKR